MAVRSRPQLMELLQRQENMLANKSLISKLPDKGEKIKLYHQKLLDELAEIDKIEESCKLFATLNIQSERSYVPDRTALENLEWQNKNRANRNVCLDSDDDSESDDPLNIIASNTDKQKKLITIEKEKKLITEEDLKEIRDFKLQDTLINKKVQIDAHTEYLCSKADNSTNKESFKPYKTLISNNRNPNTKYLHNNKHWEVTAATPPPIIHESIKEISIKDSLQLQDTQNQQFKKIQTKHATEKLAALVGKNISGLPSAIVDKIHYREVFDTNSESDDSDEETSDQEVYDDEPKEGGVVFTVTN